MESVLPNYNSILVCPDKHEPYSHKDAPKFIQAVCDKIQPEIVIDLGDEIDNHVISFHTQDPDLPFSASSELEAAIKKMGFYYDLFKDIPVKVCESNHGSLVYRKQKFHGLPRRVFKEWNDILEAPSNWSWHDRILLQANYTPTLFQHSIKANALLASKHKGMNTVQGHYHSKADIQRWKNDVGQEFFGATCGCLIDEHSLAMAYGKLFIDRPILGVLVILNGVPYWIPMILDKNNRWIGELR